MPQRVLVPYDLSDQADYALEHAIHEFDSADIVLLHVLEPFSDHVGVGAYDGTQHREQFENAETMLENVRDRYDDPDRIDTVVRYGRSVHGIIQLLNEEPFDHVVIGSHGRDGASRLLLGSVAETVARRSPVPVTVVRKPAEDHEPPEHVLVPFDASTMSSRALEYALDQFEDAIVTALYVAYPAEEQVEPTDAAFESFENWEDARSEHAESILSNAEEIADSHGRRIETETVDGTPADSIVEVAESADVDHIVMGSTGRDGLSRLLLGSVAETVVRRSPVSVTVAR